MTVVFHDEELYTELKVEAARRHTAASEIIAEAVREWLESQEDAECYPLLRNWPKKRAVWLTLLVRIPLLTESSLDLLRSR